MSRRVRLVLEFETDAPLALVEDAEWWGNAPTPERKDGTRGMVSFYGGRAKVEEV